MVTEEVPLPLVIVTGFAVHVIPPPGLHVIVTVPVYPLIGVTVSTGLDEPVFPPSITVALVEFRATVKSVLVKVKAAVCDRLGTEAATLYVPKLPLAIVPELPLALIVPELVVPVPSVGADVILATDRLAPLPDGVGVNVTVSPGIPTLPASKT
jgi:hypothetical protein